MVVDKFDFNIFAAILVSQKVALFQNNKKIVREFCQLLYGCFMNIVVPTPANSTYCKLGSNRVEYVCNKQVFQSFEGY